MSRRASKVCYWQDAPMPRDQIVLFAETLEERIPADHPVRILNEILDQMDWAKWEGEYHQRKGQPPIHPRVMCKVLLFAMIRRIRSSRQMEYNLRHSIDFIWLASGPTIDHSTLSEFRRQHPQQLKALYRQMVQLAINLGVAKLADQLPPELRDMKARQVKLQAALAQLQEMDLRRKYKGRDPQENPAQLPTTDGDSRILPNKEGGYAPNYTPMAMTEMENGFIVGADVLVGNVEHTMLTVMLDQVEAAYGERPQTALADSIFATGQNLTAMANRGQELLSPPLNEVVADNPAHREDLTQAVPEKDLDRLPKNPQTKRFDKQAFVYDAETDCYYCPAGKPLPRAGTEKVERSGETVELTVYICPDCAGCQLLKRW